MTLDQRLEAIESGYEFSLAYAAQGRSDDAGTQIRATLERMHAALDGLSAEIDAAFRGPAAHGTSSRKFLDAIRQDSDVARGAIGLVLDAPVIGSLLVDNLNATVHLRALLTDLFLVDQALKAASRARRATAS